MPRIRIAKDKADLVKALTETEGKSAPFSTYADAIVFAASLGAKQGKRSPLQEVSKKEPGPISLEIFISRGYDTVIKLLAIFATKNANVLSHLDSKAEDQRILIFEEYANGGLEILREELRGASDYTERILLMLSLEKNQGDRPSGEFDLRRFLV